MFNVADRAANQSSSALRNMAALLQQVPALQAMAAEQEAQRRAAALSARRAAIAAYREASALVESTKAAEEKAEAALAKQRQAFDEKMRELTKAGDAARSAQRQFSAASKALMVLHGEGEIERGRYSLQVIREQLAQRQAALEANRYVIHAGMFKRERPEIVAKLEAVQQQIKAVEQGQKAIAELPMTEDMDPEELAEKVQAILKQAGLRSPRDAYAADQAAAA